MRFYLIAGAVGFVAGVIIMQALNDPSNFYKYCITQF